MKKEVFRLIRDSSAKSRQGIVSIALTLLVISVLLISAPAKAVTVSFPGLPATSPENTPLTFTASVDIESGESIPVQNLELYIGAESCNFDVDGTPGIGSLCDDITITKIIGGNDCSYSYEELYGYGYGSASGMQPYNYEETDFLTGYGYSDSPGPCSLSYNITWNPGNVPGNTPYDIQLFATASNLGRDYVYVGTGSVEVQDSSVQITSVDVLEQDTYYSPFAGDDDYDANDRVNLVVEAVGALDGVTADFSSISGDINCDEMGGGPVIPLTNTGGNIWEGDCYVGDVAASHNFDIGNIVLITADGGFGNVATDSSLFIQLYSMTVPDPLPNPCLEFGENSTDWSKVEDFWNMDFTIDIKANLECLLAMEFPELEWADQMERVLLIEFEGVDMSDETKAAAFSNVGAYLDMSGLIIEPGDFGDSYIAIDDEALAEAATQGASITIYHLPFLAAPSIVDDPDAAGSGEFTWTQTPGEPEGTLVFEVDGFSGYTITDDVDPTITISHPDTEYQRSDVDIDVRVDGTGTAVSDILIEVIRGSTVMFSYDIDDCDATDLTNEVYTFSTTLSRANLPVGDYILRVNATDFGGEAGNTNIEEYSFKRRNPISPTGGGWIQSGSGWSFTMSVSNEQFINGFRKVMGVNQRFKFRYGGEDHYAGITSIEGNLVTITVWSDPQTATLAEGEYSKFDVDSDGYYDVYVEVGGVTGEVAEVTVQNIHEEVGAEPPAAETEPEETVQPEPEESVSACTPSWDCGVWSECLDGERARVCVDSSACGTVEGKPAEREACRVPVKLPWLTILLLVVIIAAVSFAVIFFLHKRYEIEE